MQDYIQPLRHKVLKLQKSKVLLQNYLHFFEKYLHILLKKQLLIEFLLLQNFEFLYMEYYTIMTYP